MHLIFLFHNLWYCTDWDQGWPGMWVRANSGILELLFHLHRMESNPIQSSPNFQQIFLNVSNVVCCATTVSFSYGTGTVLYRTVLYCTVRVSWKMNIEYSIACINPQTSDRSFPVVYKIRISHHLDRSEWHNRNFLFCNYPTKYYRTTHSISKSQLVFL